jgi:signal transduction histidine kinase
MKQNPFPLDGSRVLIEQLRLVMGNLQTTYPILLIAFLVCMALKNSQNALHLAWWFMAVTLSQIIIQLYTRHQFTTNIQPKNTQKIVWILGLLNIIDAILWGLLPWITLDTATPSGFILVFALLAGMLGAGTATHSPIPWLFIAFAIPQTLLFSLKVLLFEEATYTVMSIGILVYLFVMFGHVMNISKAVRASIKLRFDFVDSQAKLREIERKQTLDNERQRLIQDMHDGLGSSLISALRVVERGNMSDAELALVIKGCIDDLKLAIDSMEPVDKSLLLLLATLRFRLGPRLESAGIQLKWQVENIPTIDWLDPKSALHILRILQEAIANIIKHTSATKVTVATAIDGNFVVVKVVDNGTGFDVATALKSRGKGLSGQGKRSRDIGAMIDWQSTHTGTCVSLKLPILK